MSLELLAPAGSREALSQAVYHGADAVYFGLAGFNARWKAENCSDEDLSEWLRFCRKYGVKAYIAANTLIKEEEMRTVVEAVRIAYEEGADAFIVQDFGLARELNRLDPKIPLHLSTQAGVGSAEAVEFLKNRLKFSRIVLPRECGREEIAAVSKTGVEPEIFVHGALCVAFSGNCYFSSMLTGNSGNRGRCQQFCRTLFQGTLGDAKKEGYLLSLADLCLARRLPELEDMGVASLKIEGRLKRPEYVAETVRIYRKALDGVALTEFDLDSLKAVYNRGGFTEGYLFPDGKLICKDLQGHQGISIGTVESAQGREIRFRTARKISSGDGFKILRQGKEVGGGGSPVELSNGFYRIFSKGVIEKGDDVRLTTDSARNAELLVKKRRIPLEADFFAEVGDCAKLTLSACGESATVFSEHAIQPARNAPLTQETVEKQLKKLNETDFMVWRFTANILGDCFMDIAALNRMRRDGVEALNQKINVSVRRRTPLYQAAEKPVLSREICNTPRKTAIILSDLAQLHSIMSDKAEYWIYSPQELCLDMIAQFRKEAKLTYLELPYFLRQEDIRYVKPLLPYFAGVFANNPFGAQLAKECGMEVIGGEWNVTNSSAMDFYAECGINRLSVSKELSAAEIRKAVNGSALLSDLPFVSVYGRTPLMQLSHCPVKSIAGGTCVQCRYRKIELTDRTGRVFPVVRQKYSNCYFTVYNSIVQNALTQSLPKGFHYLLDMRFETAERICEVLTDLAKGRPVQSEEETTNGHLYRGVK